MGNVSLIAGQNTISFVVKRNEETGRDYSPMIDCIKMTTTAELSFDEKKSNLP